LERKVVKRWALVRVVELDLKQLSSFVGGGLPFPLEYGHLSGLRQSFSNALRLGKYHHVEEGKGESADDDPGDG
jgi:hypothetical protein